MKKSKLQDRVSRFISCRDEFDGCCHIIWLPSSTYNGVLPGRMCDILGAYLDERNQLSLLITDTDGIEQEFVTFGSLPFSVQKQLVADFNK